MTQESLLYIVGSGVCAALTTAVIFLFHRFEAAKQQLITMFQGQLEVVNSRLKDCEDDRNSLRNQMLSLHTEMHELKKRLT
jgi:septal ring factor EnvC (AmiA/AmiB activator)